MWILSTLQMLNNLEHSIYIEQVKLLYSNMRVVISGNIFAAIILLAVFWNMANRLYMGLWIALMAVIWVLRVLDTMQFLKTMNNNIIKPKIWEWRFILGTFVSGVMWGILFLLLLNPSFPEYVLFIVCGYAALVSGVNATASARVRVFIAFLLPATLPLAFSIMLVGSSLYFIMGATFFIYMLANIVVSKTFNRSIYDAIRLRFENLNLIEQLTQEKERAENAVLAKDTFLASASHDLRQPLHAQGLYLDAIEENVKTEGKQQLKSIRKTNEALANLFNSLLDVSRLNAGIVEVIKEPINLIDVLKPVIEEFKGHSERSRIQLGLDCPQTLVVVVDPVLLKRVVRNLLSNAFRYTQQGKVVIKCYAENEKVNLSINDTGIGISEDEIDNIFKEYHQLGNPERDREKGLGLGLAIVKKLCELMQIPLECKSQLGKGSYFSMTLPKSNIEFLEVSTPTEPQSVAGLHVLVIDDERDILEGMAQLLSTWGCQVMLAESAAEALKKLADPMVLAPIDLIVADYRLRENKTGAQAILQVHDFLKRKVNAVIITGDTSESRLKEATRDGFYLLYKPVSPARLRTVLHKSLQKAKA